MGVRFRVVEQLYLAPSRRILSKRVIIPSVHSASGVLTSRNNMFAFHRFLDAASHHCIMTFVYKILYWHVQRWLLDFIVDSSYVESPLRLHDDGSTRSKEISFKGFWETGMARFLVSLLIALLGKCIADRLGHVLYINSTFVGLSSLTMAD